MVLGGEWLGKMTFRQIFAYEKRIGPDDVAPDQRVALLRAELGHSRQRRAHSIGSVPHITVVARHDPLDRRAELRIVLDADNSRLYCRNGFPHVIVIGVNIEG